MRTFWQILGQFEATGSDPQNRLSLSRMLIKLLRKVFLQANIHRTCTASPDTKTSQLGNELDSGMRK